MKKSLLIVVALVLTVFMSASMLVAQEKAAAEKEKAACGMGMGAGQHEMKLTADQKAKVEELKADFQLKLIDLKAEQQKLAIMLKQEMAKPEPSMQAIEGIIKKMTPVREKIQLATIEHGIAMRKLLGPEWRTLAHPGMGQGRMMRLGPGMEGADADEGEDEDVIVMRAPMAGGDEGGRMQGKRVMKMRIAGPASGAGWRMEKSGMEKGCGMSAMKGGSKMQMGAMGAGCGIGAMKGGCAMMQKSGACCSKMAGQGHRKMFRPYGKKSGCAGVGGCMMHKGAMGAGCGMGAMKGGCAGMKEGAQKEIKCEIEIKKESKE